MAHWLYQLVITANREQSTHWSAGFKDLISPEGAGQRLSAVLASSNPVVRMRGIALLIGLGGQSESSVMALQQSGQLLSNAATPCAAKSYYRP